MNQWMKHGSTTTHLNQKNRQLNLAGKLTASDARGVSFVDYIEKRQRINSEYYKAFLDRLKSRVEIKKTRPHIHQKEGVM